MKPTNISRLSRQKPVFIERRRWVAYAAVGAATALVGSSSLEASIHYSGQLNETFPPDREKLYNFPLDQGGDYLFFERVFRYGNLAAFSAVGIVSGAFRGFGGTYPYVSKLASGQNVSAGHFAYGDPYYFHGILAQTGSSGGQQWANAGTGYIGFRFNNGAGVQYGWARVRMSRLPGNPFKVLDYAYADPGESITTGQRSSNGQSPDHVTAGQTSSPSRDAALPKVGSLGLLALGGAGILTWRRKRGQSASVS